jgi:hypothetical protein
VLRIGEDDLAEETVGEVVLLLVGAERVERRRVDDPAEVEDDRLVPHFAPWSPSQAPAPAATVGKATVTADR